jgi:hypothetical protein
MIMAYEEWTYSDITCYNYDGFQHPSLTFSQKNISLFQRLFNGDETDPRVKYICAKDTLIWASKYTTPYIFLILGQSC